MKRKIVILSLLVISLAWLLVLCFQTYSYPKADEIDKRLRYLERVIRQPLEDSSAVMLLGNESDEFMLFSYAFTTYAMTNLAVRDSMYTKRAIDLIKESIIKVLDPAITTTYGVDSAFDQLDSIPAFSVLYLGHLNLMLGCYRLLSDDSTFNHLNDNISLSLFQRYKKTKFLSLESYSESIWIPDNTVAMASLKLHSTNTRSIYGSLCSEWVEYAKANFIHKETGVLYSTVDHISGEPIEEPRGSMLGWSIMFIYQFDSDFAKQLYQQYKSAFSDNLLLFRLFKERHRNRETRAGDIDSGPIFLGYSIPANEFALSNALLAGDFKTAKKLERLIKIGANTISKNNELRYKVRFVDMNISPMAEALVLHSLTIVPWTNN